ncbi:MAG TPA: cyclic pyranopterin monophosphate synthase MoaC [Chloroflexia bacterium]|jgi:cyclic pyranopterin phosphate synthase
MSSAQDEQPKLTHVDESGHAVMVDVGAKPDTERVAVARAEVRLSPETLSVVREGRAAKGDVLAVARVAGIMAAKKTPELIPLCHPIMLTSVKVELELKEWGIEIEARAKTTGPTGVEMEALTAVSVAALTIYDMLKAIERGASIQNVRLVHKEGGKSGTWDG